ncbi:MAG: hypothetical protein R2878_03025 [Thermoleophilia bacterium]
MEVLMTRLGPELRSLLDAALANVGAGSIPDGELMQRFDEVMRALGEYLVTFGIEPDDEINDLGRQIEELEDLLVRERMDATELRD